MLSDWGIPFTERDITHDPAAVEELVRLRGVAPLTVVDGVPRWEIRELNAAGLVSTIAPVPERPDQGEARTVIADFHAWTPSGVLLTSIGSTILAWDASTAIIQRD